MKYEIYDATTEGINSVVAVVESNNGKNALKKFRQRLLSSGMYEIHRIGKLKSWEMSNNYGMYFYAIKKEEK